MRQRDQTGTADHINLDLSYSVSETPQVTLQQWSSWCLHWVQDDQARCATLKASGASSDAS